VCLFTCKCDPSGLPGLSTERVSSIGQLAAVIVTTVVMKRNNHRRYNYEISELLQSSLSSQPSSSTNICLVAGLFQKGKVQFFGGRLVVKETIQSIHPLLHHFL
jgi:hypothetical protein